MENYEKGEVKELEYVLPQWFNKQAIHMRVNAGSKQRSLLSFAVKKFDEPDVREIVWFGCGKAIGKVISCAEIMKRQFKGVQQVTDIQFKRIEEYWEPKIAGLERLKVNRDIPAIAILLSKDALDSTLPGYQALESNGHLQDVTSSSSNKKSSFTAAKRRQQSAAMAADFAVMENRRDRERQHYNKESKRSGGKHIASSSNKNDSVSDRTVEAEALSRTAVAKNEQMDTVD